MKTAMIASGGLSGGLSSRIAGGNFWSGVRQGLITSGLNHAMHSFLDDNGDPKKEKPKKEHFTKKLFRTWLFENQFFEGDIGIRAGTFIDIGFKKIFSLTIGEYSELNYKAEYFDYKLTTSSIEERFFTVGASWGIGAEYNYNLSNNRSESFSLSFFGFSVEYSFNNSIFIGFDTGISVGLGIGGFANFKGGWRFDF